FHARAVTTTDFTGIHANAATGDQYASVIQCGPTRDHGQTAFLPGAPNVTGFAAQSGKFGRTHADGSEKARRRLTHNIVTLSDRHRQFCRRFAVAVRRFDLVRWLGLERDVNGHRCSLARRAVDAERAFEQGDTLAHVDHAQTTTLFIVRVHRLRVKADAVVLDLADKHLVLAAHRNGDQICLGVFAGVVDRFFDDIEEHTL